MLEKDLLNKEVVEETETTKEMEGNGNGYLLKFKKPYSFEGETYNEIDLSNLENLTGRDMIAVNKLMEKKGGINLLPEMSLEYACEISARATKKPVEFFIGLSPKDAINLKNIVTGFLYGTE